ncbi:MAG: DUF1080 domain-containing protein [Verrucomicrobiae bacterium]|nr:DUF1080 domain-containing protein [Verrucomicrobiae bacterium]
MKTMSFSAKSRALVAALLGAFVLATLSAQAAGDWVTLFNGKDLTGWRVPASNVFWKVVDGVLVGENDETLKGSMLYTEKSYQDFIFEADVRWQGDIDSGYMVRKPELQMQIGISSSLKRDMTCSFYTGGAERYPVAGQAKDVDKYLKPGQWNTIRLQAKGNTFTVWLNGQQVTEYTNEKYAGAAPIGLQIHPKVKMKVEFRNIRIKEL